MSTEFVFERDLQETCTCAVGALEESTGPSNMLIFQGRSSSFQKKESTVARILKATFTKPSVLPIKVDVDRVRFTYGTFRKHAPARSDHLRGQSLKESAERKKPEKSECAEASCPIFSLDMGEWD